MTMALVCLGGHTLPLTMGGGMGARPGRREGSTVRPVCLWVRPGATGRARRRGSLVKEWRVYALVGMGFTIGLAGRRGVSYLAWTLTTSRKHLRLWGEASTYMEALAMKRKRSVSEESGGVASAQTSSVLLRQCTGIIDHMALRRYDDGQPRQPGRIMVETIGSMWKVTLKDPDTCQQLFVLAATLDDAITMASLLCEADDAPWEPDPWAREAKSKKSKK